MKLAALFLVSLASLAAGVQWTWTDTERVWPSDNSGPTWSYWKSSNLGEATRSAIDFAMQIMGNGSRSQYAEQLEDVLESWEEQHNPWDGTIHHLNFRATQTNCLKTDANCQVLTPVGQIEERSSMYGPSHQGNYYTPFIAPFDSRLEPGKVIKIEGTTSKYSDSLTVYVRTHAKPYFWYAPLCIKISYSADQTKIDFYHYSDKKMSAVDSHDAGKLLGLGQPFKIEVKVRKEDFEVLINDKSFTYHAQVPYEGSTHLEISSLAKLNNVVGVSPVTQRGLVKAPPTPLVLPIHDLPLRPNVNRIIAVGGNILPAAEKFDIILQNDPGVGSFTAAVVGLSFKLRDKKLEISHFADGEWVVGETHTEKAMFNQGREKGQPFYMEFHTQKDGFLLVINTEFSIEYSYRIPLESATHLAITGDLEINRVSGLNNIRDCKTNVWVLQEKMWVDSVNCVVNNELSYARFGNIPVTQK